MPEAVLSLLKLHKTQQHVYDNLSRFNVLRMGRRWGKTTLAQEYFLDDILDGAPLAFVSPTYKMLSEVWREMKRVFHPITRDKSEQEKRIEFVTNGSIEFWSGESPDSIRGRKYKKIFIDEAAMIKSLVSIFNEIIMPTLIDYGGGIIFASTPRGKNDFRELDDRSAEDDEWSSFHYTTYDNPILDKDFIDALVRSMSSRATRQEIYAEYIDNSEDAIFNIDDIDAGRVGEAPEMNRIIIGVDPAVTANKKSNMTSIVAAGRKYASVNGQFYVLSDDSGIYKPNDWAKRVKSSYDIWNADRVVGEVNNGGDLIEANIRTIAPNISYKSVRATRGKAMRAEPIAALYEQHRVHHVGHLRELETQMTTWSPFDNDSPDRIDALVWALTELMGKGVQINPTANVQNYIRGESQTQRRPGF